MVLISSTYAAVIADTRGKGQRATLRLLVMVLLLPLAARADPAGDLLDRLAGSYRTATAAAAADAPLLLSRYAQVRAPALGDAVIYWQINSGPEETLYRQRILVFASAATDGSIRQATWSLADAAGYVDAFDTPDRFLELDQSDLLQELPAACVHIWTRVEGDWHGRMAPESCRIWSEQRQAWRLIGSDVIVQDDALLYAERGYDEDGKRLFGPPEGEYYRLERLTDQPVAD